MNGWEKHSLKHVSASQVNLFANEPAMWVMQYLLGVKTSMGAAAWRGIAIEEGVVSVLMTDISIDQATTESIAKFNAKTALTHDAKRDKERDNIEPMIKLAVDALKDFGRPDFPESGFQHKIEIICNGDGWQLPLIGYLDLVYPDHGLVVDLKTTLRMPGEGNMSREHQRQRCIYQCAMSNHAVKFLYITPKKCEWRDDGDQAETMAEIKTILNRMERFIGMSDDPDQIAAIVPVIPGSFYWNSIQALAARKQYFGL